MSSEKLQDDLTLTVNGTARALRMTFNLLNRLTFLIGNVEQMQEALSVPGMRAHLMCEALALRDPAGKRVVEENLDNLEVSPDDAGRLLDWIADHVLDFFLQTLEHQNQRLLANKTRMVQIRSASTSMLNGQEDSTSKTPAA